MFITQCGLTLVTTQTNKKCYQNIMSELKLQGRYDYRKYFRRSSETYFLINCFRCPDNCPRGKLPPKLGLGFGLGLGLELGLGAIFLGSNCPRTIAFSRIYLGFFFWKKILLSLFTYFMFYLNHFHSYWLLITIKL